MGEDPSQIREEIEATRDRMAETADALAYKANVPARAKEKAQARRDALLARVRSAVPQDRGQAAGQFKAGQQALVGRSRAVTQDPQQAVKSARSAAATAKQQPQWLAAAGGIVALLGLRALRGSRRSRRSAPAAAATARTSSASAIRRTPTRTGSARRRLGR